MGGKKGVVGRGRGWRRVWLWGGGLVVEGYDAVHAERVRDWEGERFSNGDRAFVGSPTFFPPLQRVEREVLALIILFTLDTLIVLVICFLFNPFPRLLGGY